MENIIGYTGGEGKSTRWPHPMNDDFNKVIRNTVKIYGIGTKEDENQLIKARNYLRSRIKGLIDHKIRRETEEYYKAINLEITHGVGKRQDEQQSLIENSSFAMCVGNWEHDEACMTQYRVARMYSNPIYKMRYNGSIPLDRIVRYLQPVRPIKDTRWDPSKQDDVLIYESADGILELMDGNHRHEFANRVGGVDYLSGWIIKEV